MKLITIMDGVRAGNRHNQASLCRDEKGRLVVFGDVVDLFDLLKWIDKNPLTQFRVMGDASTREDDVALIPAFQTSPAFEPSEQFKRLFSLEGKVL